MKAVDQLFQARYWQVHIPDAWAAHSHSHEMVTLYSPNGVGMLEFFHGQESYDNAGANSESFGKLSGKYSGEKIHRGIYRRFWHLSCLGRKLSVRYSCSEENAEVDRSQVDAMLQTLEPHSEAAV